MPMYDYKCKEHGYFEKKQQVRLHAWAHCLTCGTSCKQVLISPPGLDIEAMANAGMPGAYEMQGDRMTKRHAEADKAGDWASRDSVEFKDTPGEDRVETYLKNRLKDKRAARHRSSG